MLTINPFAVFPHLKSLVTKRTVTEQTALDWWNSLDPETRSKWFDVYYKELKVGLSLKQLVKLHKKESTKKVLKFNKH